MASGTSELVSGRDPDNLPLVSSPYDEMKMAWGNHFRDVVAVEHALDLQRRRQPNHRLLPLVHLPRSGILWKLLDSDNFVPPHCPGPQWSNGFLVLAPRA
jgi:hypothetical protein